MAATTPENLTESVKSAARLAGFDHCGVAAAVTPDGFHHLVDWIEAGYQGEMHYLSERLDAYRHPSSILEGVKSVVILGMNYATGQSAELQSGRGRIARYAWANIDYHDLIKQRLRQIEYDLQDKFPQIRLRSIVDTAPLLEREFAQLAGLGWIGKNTMLINKATGSYFFLAALLIDHELIFDKPFMSDHCGTCTACLDACPTDAFPEPGTLDATRCISYLTIEHRSSIPVSLRQGIGEWLFGCDVCQQVCPWNRFAKPSQEAVLAPVYEQIELVTLFRMSDEDFRIRFRRTPMWRAKRRGLLRNAAIVMANRPGPNAIEGLLLGLNDHEPLVRATSAWALGQLQETVTVQPLQERFLIETDPSAIEAIQEAIDSIRRY